MSRRLCRVMLVAVVAATATAALPGIALAAPRNDAFADRTVVASAPLTDTVNTTGATTEVGEPVPSCLPAGFGSGASVWYAHTTPIGLKMSLSTIGSKYDTVLAVYTGTSLGDLAEVACSDDPAEGGLQAKLSLPTTAATTYFIQVGGFEGASGLLRFSLSAVESPINDDFADAINVTSLPFSISQSNVSAAAEVGEPGACQSPDKSLWYKFAPGAGTSVHVTTTSADLEPGAQIWRGTTLSGLEFIDCFGLPSDGTFRADVGETYYISVDTIFGETGVFDLSMNAVPAPANDDFANATEISAAPFVQTASTEGASTEGEEPEVSCSISGKTVWYSFTATQPASLVASSQGSDFDTVVAVYTGPDIGSLTEVACNDDSGSDFQSRAGFVAEPGSTYYIQIGGFLGSTGNLSFYLENGFVLDLPTGPLGAGHDGQRLDAHARAVEPVAGLAGAGAEAQYAPSSGGHVAACAGTLLVGECVEEDLP